MPIPTNDVALSYATKKSHYDTLYDNAILADTGGTAGGAQTVPGLLTLSGGTKYGVKAVASANYTITDTDGFQFILVTTGASHRTITLPTASANTGRILTIVNADAGAGHVIVDGEGAETINGFTTFGLWYQYNQMQIICDGSNWLKISPLQYVDIPEASRPSDPVLTSGSATSATDVDFGSHTPSGATVLLLAYTVRMNGNGALDNGVLFLRKNGSAITDGDQITRVEIYREDLTNAITAGVRGQCVVGCDADGVVEYWVGNAAADAWLNPIGYYQ